jgi:teichuronic acid biosynthesis glycosyltransferase TuaC
LNPNAHADDHRSAPRRSGEIASTLHVLTLTPFFPSLGNEVSGCFIKEPIDYLGHLGVASSVIAASPIHHPRKEPSPTAPAKWMRYPQLPGTLGLSSAGWLLFARLLVEVSQIHRVKPIDVIHAHGALPCGHASALLSRHLGIPFVVTVHGLDVFNTCFHGGTPAKWRRQESIAVYQAARIVICISEKVQQILRDGMRVDVRSAVVYNGTDAELFSPGSVAVVPPEKEILIVGNLIASKGHELALRAIDRMGTLFPHLRCQIIGEGPDRARLEALASKLGLGQRVRFLGRQSRTAVADAMRACSVFVLPSRNEGLGCVYLEAMACGKPVIACRGQGIDEIIEHGRNGWFIPVDGLDELAQGLSTLLQSADVSSRMGTAARETILNGLTLLDQAQRLANIYHQAIA